MKIRLWLLSAMFFASALGVWSCAEKKSGPKEHWFDCKPVLAKVAECGVKISFDGKEIASADEAYDSCEFAHGNMWLEMFRCYKLFPACEEFIECLPEHGFVRPTDDDTADDTSPAADDTSDDTAAGDDDTSDDSTGG